MTSGEADLVQEIIAVDTTDVEEGNRIPDERTSDPNRVQSMAELQAILESLLFVSSESLSVVRLTSVVGSVTKVEVEEALQGLGQALEQEGRGVRLAEIAGGYRIVTKQEYASWIKRLDKAKTAAKLSRSALESLAIIAYKQPLVRAEIEEIRGVETSGVLRTLLERKLVRIVGRKEVPGRPIMYGTTKFFLEHFGLNDLSQLPPLREFKELGEAEQSLLPIDGEMMPSEEESAEATTMGAIETELEQPMIAEVENSPHLQEMFESLPVTP
ncbi:MAG: Segregation and condensation protein B [Candidatus Nitrospira kreftii]|uniref:Segregation and condensation protein B n=1 Tax=Candidatus Nitrospira kreftii TaxID=2652173 RepID=A0A7S8IYH2_9BACT|nr:MAG: Segregation and condensation protein B [Candidatus Nitrospira kreftii]